MSSKDQKLFFLKLKMKNLFNFFWHIWKLCFNFLVLNYVLNCFTNLKQFYKKSACYPKFSKLFPSFCLFFASIVCSQFKNGSITIVSSEKALSNHIQSTTRALDIPQIQTHLDADGDEGNKEFSINIFPSQTILNKAMFDVMKFLNWTRCAIIYEQDAGECRWRSIKRDLNHWYCVFSR